MRKLFGHQLDGNWRVSPLGSCHRVSGGTFPNSGKSWLPRQWSQWSEAFPAVNIHSDCKCYKDFEENNECTSDSSKSVTTVKSVTTGKQHTGSVTAPAENVTVK